MGLYTVAAGVSPAQALDVNQYFNLLTGAMPDQLVTLANALSVSPTSGATIAPTSYGTIINKIAEVNVTTPTASVNFNNIPQVYRHLLLFHGTLISADVSRFLLAQFNNDTGAGSYAALVPEWNTGGFAGGFSVNNTGSGAAYIGVASLDGGGVSAASGFTFIFDYHPSGSRRPQLFGVSSRDDGNGRLNLYYSDFKSVTGAILSMKIFLEFSTNLASGRISMWGIP